VSLSGAPEDDYCVINQDYTTCEAMLDLVGSGACTDPEDCGDGQGGLCKTVGATANRCTYQCSVADECAGTLACNNAGQPGGVTYCH
jgi:hypothetical protein